jgi:hypothetical protein
MQRRLAGVALALVVGGLVVAFAQYTEEVKSPPAGAPSRHPRFNPYENVRPTDPAARKCYEQRFRKGQRLELRSGLNYYPGVAHLDEARDRLAGPAKIVAVEGSGKYQTVTVAERYGTTRVLAWRGAVAATICFASAQDEAPQWWRNDLCPREHEPRWTPGAVERIKWPVTTRRVGTERIEELEGGDRVQVIRDPAPGSGDGAVRVRVLTDSPHGPRPGTLAEIDAWFLAEAVHCKAAPTPWRVSR